MAAAAQWLQLAARRLAPAAALLAMCLALSGCSKASGDGLDFGGPEHMALLPPAPLEDSEVFPDSYQQAMQWGTYRPGVYFGVRGRHRGSLLMGLAWGSLNGKVLRHDCQSGELQRFGWLEHDGTSYGRQILEDEKLNVHLETAFVKDPVRPHRAWHARVRTKLLEPVENASKVKQMSLFLYFGVETGQGMVDFSSTGERGWTTENGANRTASYFSGVDPTLGKFQGVVGVRFKNIAGSTVPNLRWVAAEVPEETQETVQQANDGIWNANKHLKRLLKVSKKASAVLPNERSEGRTNWLALQFVFRPTVDFEADVHVDFDGKDDISEGALNKELTSLVGEASSSFQKKFSDVLPLAEPFGEDRHKQAAQAGLANLLGGLGYFQGRLLVKSEDGDEGLERAPDATLFSTVPSRSFFPRGFLWDEGFHGLLLVRWQPRVFLNVLGSWLGLQRESGWIPREVPLGAEQESRVPFQFLPQDEQVANPPSLLLPLAWLTRIASSAPDDSTVLRQLAQNSGLSSVGELRGMVLSFVAKALPRLALWYSFLHKTQSSERPGGFRWAGRTAAHCLASGLDDYPRGLIVNPSECHLDLHSWITFFASILGSLCQQVVGSGRLSAPQEDAWCKVPDWTGRAQALNQSLFEIFTPANGTMLADYLGKQPISKKGEVVVVPPWRTDGRCGPQFPSNEGGRSVPGQCDPYGGGPCCSPSGWCGGSPDFCECPGCKRSLTLEERRGGLWSNMRESHSPHVGYVSLFPLLLGLIPPDSTWARPLLGALDPMGSAGLWTKHGVPSLSTKDPLYGQGENYWRGKIWANMNFLAISALKHASIGRDGTPRDAIKHLHGSVLKSFVETVVNGYHMQGYFFENFDPESGTGKGAAPFTGWTTTAVLLMAGHSIDLQFLQPAAVNVDFNEL